MAQAGSSRLPTIEHPMAKMAGSDSKKLDVRGSGDPSRPCTGQLQDPIVNGKRPLASEQGPDCSRSGSRMSRLSSRRSLRQLAATQPSGSLLQQPIPEGVQVVHGDGDKTRLPVFGMRTDAAEAALDRARAASNGSQRSARSDAARLSEVQAERLEIDEIEMQIRQRVRGSYFEMRKRFMDNDPEQKGNVTRDALLRILVTALSRPISHTQLTQLFQRIGLRKDKQIINFVEFFSALREADDEEYPNWMDPISRQRQEKAQLSAAQVHADLTERMRQRFVDLADMFPQLIDGGTGRILKHELRSSLNKMHLQLGDEEFERLWKKYDPKNEGTVNGMTLLRKMGITMRGKENDGLTQRGQQQLAAVRQQNGTERPLLKAEEDRQRSLTIERWLKDKFREGFKELKAAFESHDPERVGIVSHDDFLAVLKQHSLNLEKRHLSEFLARCAVPLTKAGVMYRDFLHRFQDRSEAGMTHKIMANPHHAKEDDTTSKSLSLMETQLMNMFQRDFLSLLSAFQKIDRHSLGVISQEEFRAVMESRFGFELTDQQYRDFVNQLPLNQQGLIRYDVFMRQFDTKGMAPSLFKSEPQDAASDSGLEDFQFDVEEEDHYDPNKRSVAETRQCIHELLHSRCKELQSAFYDIDTFNSGRLTQENMYQLLRRFIKPEITRGEVRDLWKTFYLREREALDFQEFLRAFIYDARTAAFPNSKVFPPKKGDRDLMMLSKKVNSDVTLLEDGLRAKIDFLWDRLRDEFVDMDPYGTGCVTREEFQAVLKELCVQLTDYELEKLTQKFTRKIDNRVNYVELLRPFAYKKLGPMKNHMNELLNQSQTQPTAAAAEMEQKTEVSPVLQQVARQLRSELGGDWRKLRRQFRKADAGNTGFLELAEFKTAMKQFNVNLDEEQIFQLLSDFDSELKGRIAYNRFIDEARKISQKKKKMAASN